MAGRKKPPGKKRVGITPLRRRFIDEYLVDLKPTQAAIRAGYSTKTANVAAQKAMRVPEVAAEIARRQAEHAAKLEVTAEDIRRRLKAIGFASMRDVAEWDEKGVAMKDSNELPDHVAAAIESVESRDTEHGRVIRVKLHSSVDALRLLAQHLGMLVDRHVVKHEGGARLQFYLPDNGRRPKPEGESGAPAVPG